jgi:hypothetical protein
MADHALGPAWYGVRAVKASAELEAAELERGWQLEHLSPAIRELVVSSLESGKFAR